jgi:hypothetical protein
MLYKKKRGPLNQGMRLERLFGELMHMIYSMFITGKKHDVATFIKHWDNSDGGIATMEDFAKVIGLNHG